ncbi:conjugative transposon protein, TraJ [Porphyromonas gingivalis A7A1-28]|nr:conjugative transposon protein, TraJ [Porphyromonas gingivalis A7A1-28]
MVAGWIIGAGGGIGSYGRNVNQTAQRGAQGAYTGSKAMVGEAQVLLPVMSFDVSKGHSLKGSKFPLVENKLSIGGKIAFHLWKSGMYQIVA